MVFNYQNTTLRQLAEIFNREKYEEALRLCADSRTSAEELMDIYERYFKKPLTKDDPLNHNFATKDLARLMKYKLCRGKWRPRLQQSVESNGIDECKKATDVMDDCRALSAADHAPKSKQITNLVDQVITLRGVGPAAASLVLSIWGSSFPFYSDEFTAFFNDTNAKPRYTTREYLQLVDKSHNWLRQQSELEHTVYTVKELEEMIWYWFRVHDENIGDDEATSNQDNDVDMDEPALKCRKSKTSKSKSNRERNGHILDLRSYSDAWIDCHCHFTPPMSQEEYEEKWRAMNEAKFFVPEPYVWTPEATLRYMDHAGIQMQLLSNIPKDLESLKSSNDFGVGLVLNYPARFGLLAALPTNDTDAAIAEYKRMKGRCDGFAVTCHYNNTYLSDSKLDPLWSLLNAQKSVIFTHPDAYAGPDLGRPSALLEVAFETARTIVDMLYRGWFKKFPNITVIVSHCGGALPAMSGRLLALGTEAWVPNPENLTREEMAQQLQKLYLDTAATGRASHLLPGIELVGKQNIVYGSDSGVPCSTVETLEENRKDLLAFKGMTAEEIQEIGRRCYTLFPTAKQRVDESKQIKDVKLRIVPW